MFNVPGSGAPLFTNLNCIRCCHSVCMSVSGDTIALSVMTPDHLSTVGLLDYKKNNSNQGNDQESCLVKDVECTEQESM